MDITNKELVNKLPEEIISIHGNIDGIINNAGIIQPFKNFIDLEDQEIDRVININFFSTMYLTKIFLPILLTRPEALIANVSSMGGFFPFPKQTIYGSSKAAVKLFTEGLQTELEHTNIHVISVLPGGMNTNIMKNSNVQMNKKTEGNQKTMKILSPQEAAEIIVRGISKNKHKILVGKDAKMMDILYRISPTLAPKAISKAMNKVLN